MIFRYVSFSFFFDFLVIYISLFQVDNILYKYERGSIILKISDFGISKVADVNHEARGTTGRGG